MSQFQILASSLIILVVMLLAPAVIGQQPIPSALDSVAVLQRQSSEEIRKAVAILKREDVAWRNIKWETCMLKGLKRSREERKPVLLWVFIDRPIDDERC